MVVSVVYEKGKTTAGFASKVTGEIDSRLVASGLSKCKVAGQKRPGTDSKSVSVDFQF